MVVIDDFSKNGTYAIARSYMDIPQEDGVIYITNDGNLKIGDFVRCKITRIKGKYDLFGEIV